jgi:peptide/nickel transport system substrate-binding protein
LNSARLFGVDRMLFASDFPFDPDPQVYSALHSRFADYDEANPFLNPTAFRDDDVDAALDLGRRSLDEAERVDAYHEIQQRLIDDPPYVMLAFLDHTYVMTADDGWAGTMQIVEPHAHGVVWGPWWNLRDWRRTEPAE